MALAEAIPADGKVVTIEFDKPIADAAQEAFNLSTVKDKIDLRVGSAAPIMKELL